MNLTRRNLYIIGVVIFILLLALVIIPKIQAVIYQNKIAADLDNLEAKDRIITLRDIELYENSARTTLAQIIGGLALLSGLYFTYLNVITAQDNLRITEEGKLTERFSKAIELLGSEKLDVRLGGIHALGRIARDSEKDHWTVMEVLTAFVRENSHKKLDEEVSGLDNLPDQMMERENYEEEQIKPREDIQAIMIVIGRRTRVEIETQILNLQGVNLSKFALTSVNLSKADLSGANLKGVCLSKANLCETILNNADLSGADLNEANLSRTKLIKAILNESELIGTNLSEANLSEANLFVANLKETYFEKAHLKGASFLLTKHLKLEQILLASNYEDTSLPEDLKKELEDWQLKKLYEMLSADEENGE